MHGTHEAYRLITADPGGEAESACAGSKSGAHSWKPIGDAYDQQGLRVGLLKKCRRCPAVDYVEFDSPIRDP